MNLTDILRSQGGIDAIAGQLGISPADAERGAGALLPAILHGMGQQTTPEGAVPAGSGGGLADILTQLGGGALASNVIAPEPTEIDKGNSILGQIFGSKDVSRQVAGHAAQSSGLDPAIFGIPNAAIPPRRVYQRGATSLQWTAEDRNGDKLVYDVYYK